MRADRDLLLGLLAVETGAVEAAALKEHAVRAALDRSRSLAGRLIDAGLLTPGQRDVLELMADELLIAERPDAAQTIDPLQGRPIHPSLGLAEDAVAAVLAEKAAVDPAATPAPADASDRYVFKGGAPETAEIGRGGLGRVLAVFDEQLGRDVAVKELLPLAPAEGQPADPAKRQRQWAARVARFLNEARLTGQLEHPSIVPVYEIGRRRDGAFYYTMRLVRGKTLEAALGECAGLPERLRLLHHFEDLCQAIAYAHSRGVTHRDIKPHNVMIGEFGETVALDWGLAKTRGGRDADEESDDGWRLLHQPQAGATIRGQAIGTPAYMSPEQAAGEVERIDERSDVWSLGGVLYRLLTGRPPFAGASSEEVIQQVKAGLPVPVRELCPDAPADLAAVAEKALQRDPRRRYQSAKELAEEIRSYQAGARVRAYEYGSWELARRFVAKNKALSAVALLLLTTLLVGTATVWSAYREARAARRLAEANEREVHDRLAAFLAEKAEQAFGDRNFLAARVYSAASLLHSPFNPYGPHRHPEPARLQSADAALRVARSHSWLFQAGAHGRLRSLAALRGHGDNVTGLAFSPDGRWLALASGDKTISLWEAAEQRRAAELRGHADSVRAVCFTPDGRLLISASRDKTVRLWDPAAAKSVGVLVGHDAEVRALAVSPDGRWLASGGRDKRVIVWDLAARRRAGDRLLGHEGAVEALAISPDGAVLASAGADKTVRLWRASDRRAQGVLRGHVDGVLALAFSHDGGTLASAGWDRVIRLWDVATQTPLGALEGHEDGVRGLAFSPDGALLASAGWDKTLRLWSVAERRLEETALGHSDGLFGAAFHPRGTVIATAGADKTARLWRLAPRSAVLALRGHVDRVAAVAFSPDGRRAATASFDRTARVWDASTGAALHVLNGHADAVSDVKFSPHGGLLATANADRAIRLWDAGDGAEPAALTGHEDGVLALSFAPDGRTLASASRDKTIGLWDLTGRQLIERLRGHDDIVWRVAFSPDGRLLASASFDKTVGLWDVASRRLLRRLSGHEHWVSDVAFAPDGRTLASAGRDKTIRLWTLPGGEPLRTLSGHQEWVNYVAVSPDSRLILSGSDDRTARLWDAAAGKLLQIVKTSYEVAAVAFAPDGRRFAVADKNDALIYPVDFDYWKRDPQALLDDAERDAGLRLEGAALTPQ